MPPEVIQDWLAAKKIIADFLREARADWSNDQLDHNAAAIIARLAYAEPPLLISREEPEPEPKPSEAS